MGGRSLSCSGDADGVEEVCRGPHEAGEGGPLKLQNSQEVDELASDETYTYLGVEKLLQTKAKETKRRIRKKYMHRLHQVWGSDLAAGAKRAAHNAWVVAVCPYYFTLGWSRANSKELDRWSRKALRRYQAHHAGASIDRLYMPVAEGGRGLRGVELSWERELVTVAGYLRSSQDRQVQGQ